MQGNLNNGLTGRNEIPLFLGFNNPIALQPSEFRGTLDITSLQIKTKKDLLLV